MGRVQIAQYGQGKCKSRTSQLLTNCTEIFIYERMPGMHGSLLLVLQTIFHYHSSTACAKRVPAVQS